MSRITIDLEAYPLDLVLAVKVEERITTSVRILKQRPTGPSEFTFHPHFRFEDTPVDRARRELGFPIQEK